MDRPPLVPGTAASVLRKLRMTGTAIRRRLMQASFVALLCVATHASANEISFNRDIRPILSANCYACHGPDKKAREADRRLDTREGALAESEGVRAIVPGNIEQSELVIRISSNDRDEIMPPPKSDKKLTAQQIALLKQWIKDGAQYEAHWSLIAPKRPKVPGDSDFKFQISDWEKREPERGAKLREREKEFQAWPRNPIDNFILARLLQEGLAPSPEASRTTQIRRLSYDLTGLPPTPAEIEAFLSNTSHGSHESYGNLADKLLASSRYGERMARDWLDLSRYADTHGYHLDGGRDMWLWRNWVIKAFNENKPFDQFTIEQFAGDLLPNATEEQKIATGFHRNAMINFEGGALPEEYLTYYIKDRVTTTATAYLGLTLQCAECHDHKFDPVTQKEFYQLYAFFNAVPENGIDGSKGNAAPLLRVAGPGEKSKLAPLEAEKAAAERALADVGPRLDAEQRKWEEGLAANARIAWMPLDPLEVKSHGGATLTKLEDKSVLASGENPATDVYEFVARVNGTGMSGLRLETLPDASLAGGGTGRAVNGNFVLSGIEAEAVSLTDPKAKSPVKLVRAAADYSQRNYEIEKAIDGDKNSGWAVDGPTRKGANTAWFAAEKPFGFPGGTELRVRLRFESPTHQHAIGRARLAYTTAADPVPQNGALPANMQAILALPSTQRSAQQQEELRKHFREKISTEAATLNARIAARQKAIEDFQKAIPTVMVMQEAAKPRDSFVLVRGQYNQHGEKVAPDVPASLPALPAGAPRNRLGFAKWLVDPANPLVARVTVNRLWQSIMGTGIVKTTQDFGSQGEWPSHPELLDWLATEFVESGWDVKHIVKLIVTSATYQQASRLTPELRERDPENRLYARGPRFRLGAEEIRDSALFLSGLLVEKIGGPSVRPYQPPGLWEELSSRQDSDKFSAQKFVQDHGESLYRRSLYTFWKRTSPPPSLTTFDAPDREKCIVGRERTNTPLQALVLMNDPTYVEAARKLAERMMKEGGVAPAERVAIAFRLATARMPSESETRALVQLFEKQRARFAAAPEQASVLLAVGESSRNDKLDPAELAAWTSVASTILNLDETVTKG